MYNPIYYFICISLDYLMLNASDSSASLHASLAPAYAS